LGQTLFEFPAPTGYPDFALLWWNTGQAFGRWTLANIVVNYYFGEQLTPNSAPANALLDQLLGLPKRADEVVDDLVRRFIGRDIEAADRQALINELGNGSASALIASDSPRLRPVIAVIAASPYAQWR
ncbi:MAG: DUF1800 domain-containing protein, partial [Thermoflexales bacterium]|nr:DUF1800 domain-containing protein [Thermoflexales bacterium]